MGERWAGRALNSGYRPDLPRIIHSPGHTTRGSRGDFRAMTKHLSRHMNYLELPAVQFDCLARVVYGTRADANF